MNEDLKIIKKYYGEKMMHLCRQLFPTLLEEEGCLSNLMLDNFAPNKFLYDDIVKEDKINNFKNYIYKKVNIEPEKIIEVKKNPKQLLSEIGYDLYECKTEHEIQKFKKYYASGEKLCTFNGGRLNRCHVFFAVKKNVDEIKRKNFEKPERQDEYGTSVISIQFTKGDINTLSIKNRYNHTVENPDATFSNNLENITVGLTRSFEKEYNFNINQTTITDFELNGYVYASDGKYYKYNHEINNIYYCPNNVIIDNFVVQQYPKERFIVLDYFILDLKEKTITMYDPELSDSFISVFNNIEKINVINNKENKIRIIEIKIPNKEKIIIKIDKTNQIIEYKNNNMISTGNNFLRNNKKLCKIQMNNIVEIGLDFLCFNEDLIELSLPKLREAKDNFLGRNKILQTLYLPKVKKIYDQFLYQNIGLRILELLEVEEIGDCFLINNFSIETIELPKVKKVGRSFLWKNYDLKKANFPCLEVVGSYFLEHNRIINEAFFPMLVSTGRDFMCRNTALTTLDLPNIRKIKFGFLHDNNDLKEFNAPKLYSIDCHYFLCRNKKLELLNLPNLRHIESYFLYYNLNPLKLYLPKLNNKQREILTPYFNLVNEEKNLYEKPIKKVDYINETLKDQIRKIRRKIIIKQRKDYASCFQKQKRKVR